MQNTDEGRQLGGRNQSSSLRRALSILEALTEPTSDQSGLSLSQLASSIALNKSTLLRLLDPLLESRLAEHGPDGRYRLGVGAVTLGGAYLAGLDLRRQARPILERLARETGETIHLLVYGSGEMTYIEKIAGPSAIQMASRVGDRVPAYCTASGKVFLAHLPESHFDTAVAAGMPARTPNTITTPDALRRDLLAVRERGYGIDDIENEPDIRCVSAPVFDHNGHIVSAISTSGPATSVYGDHLIDLAKIVRHGADELSQRLGAPQNFSQITQGRDLKKKEEKVQA